MTANFYWPYDDGDNFLPSSAISHQFLQCYSNPFIAQLSLNIIWLLDLSLLGNIYSLPLWPFMDSSALLSFCGINKGLVCLMSLN